MISCLSIYTWTSWSKVDIDMSIHGAYGHEGPRHTVVNMVFWPSPRLLLNIAAMN